MEKGGKSTVGSRGVSEKKEKKKKRKKEGEKGTLKRGECEEMR